jgi:alanyl-tRNA synthetase
MKFGDKDNFWAMGDTGACGPCSEIFYDQGEEHFHGSEDYMGGDGDRFLEIWNLVFMQYERDEEGNLHPLPKPSIDTGMGYERIAAIKEGVRNNYHSTLFMPYLEKIGELVGEVYAYEAPNSASYRVIADHLRSTSFLLAQGINFDKEGRGYVLRRIMRRAIRHGYLLGLREPFMYKLVDTLVEVMGAQYGYLEQKAHTIKSAMKLEEERFFDTIEQGIKLFSEELEKTGEVFSGEVAFKLYDTYGFPLDLTQDMLREKNILLDEGGFEAKMNEQREQSKAAWKGAGDAVATGDFKALKEEFGLNKFVGYSEQKSTTKVLALLDNTFQRVEHVSGSGWVMLESTPFYAESGGQVGDRGSLNGDVTVVDTKKFLEMNLSQIEGALKVGDDVVAIVAERRTEIEKHHSATHLLHAALREVLGEHVAQAGSYNDDTRLRFDFSHPQAMGSEELEKVEAWVNDKIARSIETRVQSMSMDEAKESGAIALFDEKYGDKVRVVNFAEESIELCGGTHVANTAQIGLFMITKESGVSAGVRRIEAICGREAYRVVGELRSELQEIQQALKAQDALSGIMKLKEQVKQLKGEVQSALKSSKRKLEATAVNGVHVIVDEVESGDIKSLIDESKNRYDKVAIMLFQKKGDKVLIACGAKGITLKAGTWIKEIAPILGGGGGGRPDFAQAGGKDVAKISEAREAAFTFVKENL